MIDTATVIKLFKELLEVIDRRKRGRRRIFSQICTPLYSRLEPIAKDYYEAIRTASTNLDKTPPDLQKILRRLTAKRKSIIIVKNGLVGDAESILGYYQVGCGFFLPPIPPISMSKMSRWLALTDVRRVSKPQFTPTIRQFAEAIVEYFSDVDIVIEGTHYSPMYALINVIQALEVQVKLRTTTDRDIDFLRQRAHHLCRALEMRWTNIAKHYGTLRILSES